MTGADLLDSSLAGFDLLSGMDLGSFVFLFWYTLLLELPRYVVGGLLIVFAGALAQGRSASYAQPAPAKSRTFSVVVAGHNEAGSLSICIRSLLEQSAFADRRRGQIIVIDDGSTDGMSVTMARLQRQGLIDLGLRLRLRGGKSAAVNLALRHCWGEVVVIVDADTTFDRDAIDRLLAAFDDPTVGAAGGNIEVRNAWSSLTTRFQAIEYMISISLGRRVGEMLGLLSIVSGAFGAFRREAVEAVGGQDVEVGEDADLTMKLLRAGWRVVFVPKACAATDVPDAPLELFRQRMRWDRGIVTIWMRKYRSALNPFSANFHLGGALILFDVALFQIGLSVAFLAYLVWLFLTFGAFAWVLLAATMLAYVGLAAVTFLAAAASTGVVPALRLLPYIPYYALFNCTVMRMLRLIAVLDELIFRTSFHDPYVPRRVMDQVERF